MHCCSWYVENWCVCERSDAHNSSSRLVIGSLRVVSLLVHLHDLLFIFLDTFPTLNPIPLLNSRRLGAFWTIWAFEFRLIEIVWSSGAFARLSHGVRRHWPAPLRRRCWIKWTGRALRWASMAASIDSILLSPISCRKPWKKPWMKELCSKWDYRKMAAEEELRWSLQRLCRRSRAWRWESCPGRWALRRPSSSGARRRESCDRISDDRALLFYGCAISKCAWGKCDLEVLFYVY